MFEGGKVVRSHESVRDELQQHETHVLYDVGTPAGQEALVPHVQYGRRVQNTHKTLVRMIVH